MSAPDVAHFDGACEPTNPGGTGGWGFVIKDSEGNVLVKDSGILPAAPAMTNNVAEYTAAMKAIMAYEDLGRPGPLEVRGDSKMVVEQMSGRWCVKKGAYVRIARKAKEQADKLALTLLAPGITWTWIPRARNDEADALSKEGLRRAGVRIEARGKESAMETEHEETVRQLQTRIEELGEEVNRLRREIGDRSVTIRRYDEQHDRDRHRIKELVEALNTATGGTPWIWAGDETDDLETLCESATVSITAGTLRAMLAEGKEATARLARYRDGIGDALAPVRARRSTGEPAASDAAEIKRLRDAVSIDQTGLARALDEVRKIAGGWSWLGDPDAWGSYTYDQRTIGTIRGEAGRMVDAVERCCTEALRESGDIAIRVLRDGDTLAVDPNPLEAELADERRLTAELRRVAQDEARQHNEAAKERFG